MCERKRKKRNKEKSIKNFSTICKHRKLYLKVLCITIEYIDNRVIRLKSIRTRLIGRLKMQKVEQLWWSRSGEKKRQRLQKDPFVLHTTCTVYTQHVPYTRKFVCKRERMCVTREKDWEGGGRGREEKKERKNIATQGMKCRKNRIETWSRALGALSTSRLGSPCRHLRDVMWGNSWSLFSYLVCSLATFAFCERGNLSLSLSLLSRDFPLLLF